MCVPAVTTRRAVNPSLTLPRLRFAVVTVTCLPSTPMLIFAAAVVSASRPQPVIWASLPTRTTLSMPPVGEWLVAAEAERVDSTRTPVVTPTSAVVSAARW